jgi:hypothetical protein
MGWSCIEKGVQYRLFAYSAFPDTSQHSHPLYG